MYSIDSILKYYENKKYAQLSQKAYDILVDLIISLNLLPGGLYSEGEISEMIGIGRTPIRDASKRLEFLNMVTIFPRSGIQVSSIQLESPNLEREVRVAIEGMVIQKTAESAFSHERKLLKELTEKYAAAAAKPDVLDLCRVDLEFHTTVAQIAQNPYARNALLPLLLLECRMFFLRFNAPEQQDENFRIINESHIKLMQCIVDGRGQEATEYLRKFTYLDAEPVSP